MHIDPNLYQGRPADCTGRLDREIACYDLLDALGISYTRADHDAADTIADCHAIEGLLGAAICKNLVLCNRQKTDFYLLLMEGDKPFRTKDLSKQIGSSRLSFAAPEDMEQYLGVTPGSATILSLMNDKEHKTLLVVDKDILRDEMVCCHPLTSDATVAMHRYDLIKFVRACGNEIKFLDIGDGEHTEE